MIALHFSAIATMSSVACSMGFALLARMNKSVHSWLIVDIVLLLGDAFDHAHFRGRGEDSLEQSGHQRLADEKSRRGSSAFCFLNVSDSDRLHVFRSWSLRPTSFGV